MKNNTKPAQPCTIERNEGNGFQTTNYIGLTKQEFISAQILSGLLSNPNNMISENSDVNKYVDLALMTANILLQKSDPVTE